MKILLTALLIFLSLNSFAQSTVGVKVGGGQSILANKYQIETGYGYQLGLVYNYRATKNSLINVEGLFFGNDYGTIGSGKTDETGQQIEVSKERWTSLGFDIPVTFRVNTNGEKANLFVEGGGYAGYWMGSRFFKYSSFNVGLIIGLGINVKAGKHDFVISGRYNSPLTKQFEYKNHAINASVAFMF